MLIRIKESVENSSKKSKRVSSTICEYSHVTDRLGFSETEVRKKKIQKYKTKEKAAPFCLE